MIYIIFISISFLLFWITESKNDTIDAYPLILVDGKVAPRLSPLPFHIENSFVNIVNFTSVRILLLIYPHPKKVGTHYNSRSETLGNYIKR